MKPDQSTKPTNNNTSNVSNTVNLSADSSANIPNLRAQQSFEQYCKMRYYEFNAQNILMDNFQLLFLKKYDQLLTSDERWIRDRQDTVVMATSTTANVGAFGFILSQLSFLQETKFNPIRDMKVFLAGAAFMLLFRGAGVLYMWSQIEPIYFRIQKDIDFNQSVDFYAHNVMSTPKIFLYRNFF